MFLISHARRARPDDPEFETLDLAFAAALQESRDGKAWAVRGADSFIPVGLVMGGEVFYRKSEFDRLSAELAEMKKRYEQSKASHERTLESIDEYFDDSNR